MALDRRSFLLASSAALIAAACGESGSTSSDDAGSGTTAPSVSGAGLEAAGGSTLFALGVASGDPLADSVILWTRLGHDPLRGGGLPADDIEVEWEVAADDSFGDVVASGTTTATAAMGHAVHVDAGGLDPDTWYHYRFRVGDDVSPVGRTRTFPEPDASPDRLRLAVANCQDYGSGYYAAYRDLVEAEVDVVLFLGDYIYETVGVDDPDEAVAQRRYFGGEPMTVADYRQRYAITQLDPQLQAAHAAAPWIVTFDDHEVTNDYAGDDGAEDGSGPAFAERRIAAYQAWYESLPLRIPPPAADGSLDVHRAFSYGELARFFVIETRQHADPPPCRETSVYDVGPTCAEREAEDRTALGAEQEAWLLDGLAENRATWQVLVNPVLMAGLDIGQGDQPPSYFLETWDGYPAERRRILTAVAERDVRNPVVLTGDYHASFVNDLRPDPWDTSTPVVAPELLGTAISSVPFRVDFPERNPQVRYAEDRNGYLLCDVTPTAITAEFRHVADVADADSAVTVDATFTVEPSPDGGAPTVSQTWSLTPPRAPPGAGATSRRWR